MADYPSAQWFDALPKCRDCPKPSTGSLMSFYGNAKLGHFCAKCAEKRIREAHRKHKQFAPDMAIDPQED